jgi:UPF0716 protein FxsA
MLRIVVGSLFIALPLLELALLVKTGQLIGVWPTLAVVVGTAFLGAYILTRQSWTVMRGLQAALARGEPPVAPILDGTFLALAGVLLVTPGLLSDATGLLLLIPPVRRRLARMIMGPLVRRAEVRVRGFGAGPEERRGGPSSSRPGSGQGPIIEGEFQRLGEKATGPHRGNGADGL